MKKINNKITVIGGYGGGNIGDDALMWNVIKWINIEFPLIKPLVVVYDKTLAKGMLKGLNVDVVDAFESYEINTEVAIYGGGTQFFQFNNRSELKNKLLFEKILGILKNPIKKLSSIKKKLTTRVINAEKKVLLGIGFGPFHDKESRSYHDFLNVLNNSDYIFIRDNKSYSYIPEEYKKKVELGIDICYNSLFFNEISKIKNDVSPDEKKVGVIIRDWVYDNIDQNLIYDNLIKYIEKNKEDSFEIIFLCEQLDNKLYKYFSHLPNVTTLSWNPQKFELLDFFKTLNTYKLVITSRFHGALFSAIMNIPFITIEIEPKLQIPNSMYDNKDIIQSPFDLIDIEDRINRINTSCVDYSEHNQMLLLKGDKMFSNLKKRVQAYLDNH